MYTILLSLVLFAVFLFYNSSEKVKFGNRPEWLIQLSQQKILIRGISIGIGIISMLVILWQQGSGAGFFALFAYLMALLSVVVLLNPYKYLRWSHLIVLFLIAETVELFVF